MTTNNLIPGKYYNVIFGNGCPNFTRNGETPSLIFNKSFSCYDARFHGVGNPDDYVCFEFQLPEKLGVWRAFRFQILSID